MKTSRKTQDALDEIAKIDKGIAEATVYKRDLAHKRKLVQKEIDVLIRKKTTLTQKINSGDIVLEISAHAFLRYYQRYKPEQYKQDCEDIRSSPNKKVAGCTIVSVYPET